MVVVLVLVAEVVGLVALVVPEVVAEEAVVDEVVAAEVMAVVVGRRVVEVRIEDVEAGAAASTPVSGRSLTSDPAAFTATYAIAVVASVASSQSKNRELRCI